MVHSNVLVIISRDNVVKLLKLTFFVKIKLPYSVQFKVTFKCLFQTIIFCRINNILMVYIDLAFSR